MRENCPDHQDGLLSYLQLYYCALPNAKPLAFAIIVVWLSLLFSTIGIAASDFLCIDLSTLAVILGMSESLTGVTFLAFGNGSPDVFSTFAAMRSNSGSLAIGELIGAATFITSVVAGSMALVRPFRVARRSFVRDVGFFVIAVGFSMILVADGRLQAWESFMMVAMYAFYVVLVVSWHWYLVRRRRKYERDLAARTHFHIPDNQELEIEEQADDDDPGVAPESRSLLRGASTDDFDLLERANGLPTWKEEDDEDDETRNRYLAEIRDNMHVYRRSMSRRNTINPIRPSLVGALEFQSVLQALQKSRTSRHNPTISLSSYSDDGDDSTQPFDARSTASSPRVSRPSTINDRLSPHSAEGSRARAVSMNDADRLKIDASVFDRLDGTPRLTLRRPSDEPGEIQTPQLPRINTNALSTASPSSPEYLSPNASPTRSAVVSQTPDLLAPSGPFNTPNYQTTATQEHSPLSLSPCSGTPSCRSGIGPESPSVPFPTFIDISPTPSSRAPSIYLPNPVASPSEQLMIHDGLHDTANDNVSLKGSLMKWWPSSALPSPGQIGCALFPTLAGWKSKSIAERLLGITAAPSVLLLTITVPVIEPEMSESDYLDPIPTVIIEGVGENGNPEPRVRLPADSPTFHPIGHEHSQSRHKSIHPEQRFRARIDSEMPAVPHPPPDAARADVKDWNRWLIAIQLFTGPFFVTLIAWSTVDETLDAKNLLLPSLVSLLFSFLCLSALVTSTRRRRPWHHHDHVGRSYFRPQETSELSKPQKLPSAWRPFLSLLGFLVAISWIATIATEVVSVLKTIGVILNISDSLLGLTIFAVGNSLGDLVADITVARLGYPVMALSACFGGPMLNILLGVGLGGLYMTLSPVKSSPKRDEMPTRVPYEITISKMLVISSATLLIILVGLLIVVPLNNWRMDRRIGWGLIAVWCVSTVCNVIAEVVS